LVVGALLIGSALAACDGESEAPKPSIDSTLVDGKVCGLFNPDLVKSVIGHAEIKVRGTGIGDVTQRTDNTIDCEVIDDERVKTAIQVIVAEQPATSDQDATTTMLDNELATKTDCSSVSSITDLGATAGYVCTLPNGRVTLNVLLSERLFRLVYEPGPDAKGGASATAVKLVKDANANIEAYDKKHG
jgi:hypothetical protein